MAKCKKCNKRKAKRYCAALGDSLCSLCCGLLREKEIHCPPSCSFLEKHKSYQDKRAIEQIQPSLPSRFTPEEDILQDERIAWLAFQIEIPLKIVGEKKDSFTDKDALLALEYAKNKIEKDSGLFLLPEGRIKPTNEVGEMIYQSIEKCRYEKKIIIPGEFQTYKKEEKIKCLDRIILSVRFFARGNFEARGYVQQLIKRFAKIDELSLQKKLLTIT